MKITLLHHLLFVNHLFTNRQLFMSMVNYQEVSFLKIAGLRSLLSPEMGHPQTNSGCKIEMYQHSGGLLGTSWQFPTTALGQLEEKSNVMKWCEWASPCKKTKHSNGQWTVYGSSKYYRWWFPAVVSESNALWHLNKTLFGLQDF